MGLRLFSWIFSLFFVFNSASVHAPHATSTYITLRAHSLSNSRLTFLHELLYAGPCAPPPSFPRFFSCPRFRYRHLGTPPPRYPVPDIKLISGLFVSTISDLRTLNLSTAVSLVHHSVSLYPHPYVSRLECTLSRVLFVHPPHIHH